MKPEDLFRLNFLREVVLSPEGSLFSARVEKIDGKGNKYVSDLIVGEYPGRNVKKYLRGRCFSDVSFSPDGKLIVFKENRHPNKTLISAIPVGGGEPFEIVEIKGRVRNYLFTPDGRYLIAGICLFQEEEEPIATEVEQIPYKREGEGFINNRVFHIYRIDVRSGRMEKLTDGKTDEIPSDISPDGKYVVYSATESRDYRRFQCWDICILNLRTGKRKRLKLPSGFKSSPVFTPDGKHIVYSGYTNPEEFRYRLPHLWITPINGAKPECLTEGLDYHIGNLVLDDRGGGGRLPLSFSEDGETIYFPVTERGRCVLYSLKLEEKKFMPLIHGDFNIFTYDHKKGRFVLGISDFLDPGSIYTFDKGVLKRRISFNKKIMRKVELSIPERVSVKGYDGDEVEGWLMKPVPFEKGKKYPLLVEVHGGPHMCYGYSFFHEFHVLTHKGYAVFFSNPHGSVGYGEKFTLSLHRKWGEPDKEDIKRFLRKLKKLPFVDEKRIGVLGGSYGGFSTVNLLARTSLFRAGVAQRGVYDFTSFASSDMGFIFFLVFCEGYGKDKDYEFLWNMSPLRLAKNIKAPLLIIHSTNDLRTPFNQGEELYVALKMLGKKVKMVIFPDENHNLSRHGRPDRRIARLKYIISWFEENL